MEIRGNHEGEFTVSDTRLKNFDAYYQKLDCMSDALVFVRNLMETNPNMQLNEILDSITNNEFFKKLDHESYAVFLRGIKAHFESKTSVDSVLERFDNDPEKIFEYTFNFKPKGRVEISREGGFLGFIIDWEDGNEIYDGPSSSYTPENSFRTGVYFDKHSYPGIPPELDGRIFFTTRNVNVSNSSQRKRYILYSGGQIQSTCKHEANHALWQEIVGPLKAKVVNEKRSFLKKMIQPELIVLAKLEEALSLYFVGDNHIDKLISESGPTRFRAILRANVNYPYVGIEDDINDATSDYRTLFFKLFDAIGEVKARIDPRKLEALVFLLPADRIERLLHFIGKNPTKWLEEWEANNNQENLRQREEDLIIKMGK